MTDLIQAKACLEEGYTCALCRGSMLFKSTLRGVRPLIELYTSQQNVEGAVAADRVVGKASSMLYCLLKVRLVYAPVMSKSALAMLQGHGIEARYDRLADAIINRTGDGLCPMEQATRDLTDPADAPDAITRALEALQK